MKNVLIEGTEPVELISAPSDNSIAVICLAISNFGDGDSVVNLYACESGKEPPQYDPDTGELVSGDESCWLVRELSIKAKDTFIFNLEKLLLHPGDKLYAQKLDDMMKVAITISYEAY